MKNIKYYELNSSQEVVKLQCKYSLFKRVINILSSASTDKEIDLDIMTKALNKVIERNDCLRIRFVKRKGKIMQYFVDSQDMKNFGDVPYLEFQTKQEQEAFIAKFRKKPIKYMHGVVMEPYFCKTFDNKFMVIMKVCHLILDIYGLTNIYKDLFAVYDALKENKELPKMPTKFEDVIIKDLSIKHNEELHQKNKEFFAQYLAERECPYFAGIPGPNEPITKKELEKGRRSSKLLFVRNDTQGYMHHIDSKIVERALKYCEEKRCSISNFFFYTMCVCASRINNDVKNMLPIELCNCRGTLTERNAGGTKAQSLGCYTTVEKEKTFEENFSKFVENQAILYRHVGFSDLEFEALVNKTYKKPLLNTYYSIAYSFIPTQKSKDFDIQLYSNGKCALPAYIAVMWDMGTNDIDVIYDCYRKTHNEENVRAFHNNFLSIIEQVLDNDQFKIKELNIRL